MVGDYLTPSSVPQPMHFYPWAVAIHRPTVGSKVEIASSELDLRHIESSFDRLYPQYGRTTYSGLDKSIKPSLAARSSCWIVRKHEFEMSTFISNP